MQMTTCKSLAWSRKPSSQELMRRSRTPRSQRGGAPNTFFKTWAGGGSKELPLFLASWNARALFHHQLGLRGRKLSYLSSLFIQGGS
eukprot:5555111-Pyramimonas_sp.AAC.1